MQTNEPRQLSMLSNIAYDLNDPACRRNQSLWLIKNNYKNDASNDDESKNSGITLELTNRII